MIEAMTIQCIKGKEPRHLSREKDTAVNSFTDIARNGAVFHHLYHSKGPS